MEPKNQQDFVITDQKIDLIDSEKEEIEQFLRNHPELTRECVLAELENSDTESIELNSTATTYYKFVKDDHSANTEDKYNAYRHAKFLTKLKNIADKKNTTENKSLIYIIYNNEYFLKCVTILGVAVVFYMTMKKIGNDLEIKILEIIKKVAEQDVAKKALEAKELATIVPKRTATESIPLIYDTIVNTSIITSAGILTAGLIFGAPASVVIYPIGSLALGTLYYWYKS